MAVSRGTWRVVLLGLSAVNLAGVGLAAGAAEGAHAALHAALAVALGLWAERLGGRRRADETAVSDAERLEVLEGDVAGMRRELSEAQERLDFAERLLARSREQTRVEGGRD